MDKTNKDIIISNDLMEKVLNAKTYHIQQLDNILHNMLPILPKYHDKCSKYPQEPDKPKHSTATKTLNNTHFIVKHGLLQLLRDHGLSKRTCIFTFKEVAAKFHKYVKAHKELIDNRNKSMINCMNHELGEVLGIKALHMTQIVPAIYGQLIPIDKN